MDLKEISKGVNEVIENKRKELDLTFIEDRHVYYMRDVDGKIKSTFPSVSKIIKKYYPPFDQEKIALNMSKGDINKAKKLINEWKEMGRISTNLGSRAHFLLEKDIVHRYNDFKEVRMPIFQCRREDVIKSDKMVEAGKRYIDLMHNRGAVLLDTEIVLGHPELGYTGQPDNGWLMENKEKNGIGIVITDWKTNQPKNFKSYYYTKKMYRPFNNYDDNALNHYYVQIPLYAKLILKMLEGSEFENIKFLGGVVVLLKEDGTYSEYRVPKKIIDIVFNTNII